MDLGGFLDWDKISSRFFHGIRPLCWSYCLSFCVWISCPPAHVSHFLSIVAQWTQPWRLLTVIISVMDLCECLAWGESSGNHEGIRPLCWSYCLSFRVLFSCCRTCLHLQSIPTWRDRYPHDGPVWICFLIRILQGIRPLFWSHHLSFSVFQVFSAQFIHPGRWVILYQASPVQLSTFFCMTDECLGKSWLLSGQEVCQYESSGLSGWGTCLNILVRVSHQEFFRVFILSAGRAVCHSGPPILVSYLLSILALLNSNLTSTSVICMRHQSGNLDWGKSSGNNEGIHPLYWSYRLSFCAFFRPSRTCPARRDSSLTFTWQLSVWQTYLSLYPDWGKSSRIQQVCFRPFFGRAVFHSTSDVHVFLHFAQPCTAGHKPDVHLISVMGLHGRLNWGLQVTSIWYQVKKNSSSRLVVLSVIPCVSFRSFSICPVRGIVSFQSENTCTPALQFFHCTYSSRIDSQQSGAFKAPHVWIISLLPIQVSAQACATTCVKIVATRKFPCYTKRHIHVNSKNWQTSCSTIMEAQHVQQKVWHLPFLFVQKWHIFGCCSHVWCWSRKNLAPSQD